MDLSNVYKPIIQIALFHSINGQSSNLRLMSDPVCDCYFHFAEKDTHFIMAENYLKFRQLSRVAIQIKKKKTKKRTLISFYYKT